MHNENLSGIWNTVFLRSDAVATFYFAARFSAATIRGWHLFLCEACRHQRWPEKVRTSDTATTVRLCQWLAQPLGLAVSCGNKSYNTNSPSASLVTVVRKHPHVCVPCVLSTATIRGKHLFCSEPPFVQLLFKHSDYSKKYSTCGWK